MAGSDATFQLYFSKAVGRLWIIICLAILSVCGCSQRQTTQISDVTKTNTMVLTPSGATGSYLDLHVHGHIDGVATLSGSWIQYPQKISNAVAFKQSGDHYDTNCVLVYSPATVKSGTLTVDNEFR
jgi:hypothetical protein